LIEKCYIEQSLRLLNYLLLNGSERVVSSTREHLYDMRGLETYSFTDDQGRDQGINGKLNSSRVMCHICFNSPCLASSCIVW